MSGRRKWIYSAVAIALLLTLVLLWNWSAMRAHAAISAAYSARITCSCRYVEHRSMESCAYDKARGTWMVSMTDHPESQTVDAHIPLLARSSAYYRKGWGCLFTPGQ